MIRKVIARTNWILTGLGLGALYWVVESAFDIYAFGIPGTFTERLLSPDLNETSMRLIIVGLLTGFGAFAQYHVGRLSKLNRAASKSERRYRSLFENSPISLLEYDLTELIGKCQRHVEEQGIGVREAMESLCEDFQKCAGKAELVDCNTYTLELFEASDISELAGGGLNTIISTEAYDTLTHLIEALVHEEQSFSGEAVSYTLSGRRLRTVISASELPEREDSLRRVIFHIDDLTLLKETEDELRMIGEDLEQRVIERTASLAESEERFRELAENIDEVFWLLDPDGNVIYISPGYERIWERPRQELYERSRAWMDSVHPEDRQRVEEELHEMQSGGYDVEFRVRTKDRTERWVRDRRVPVRASDGQVMRVAGITEDITVLKTANIRLQELDRLKSMFIAGISHELRTPLNSIIGFTTVLLEGWAGELQKVQREYLNIVNSSSRQLLLLIDDVIDITKIEAGKLDIWVQEFDLRDLLKEAADTVRRDADHKHLLLNVKCESIRVSTDRRRLMQAVVNLLTNAIKYTEKGSITLAARRVGDTAELLVTDSGIGIKNEDIHLLFQPFARLGVGTTNRERGTGLGLYLVSKLASEVLHGSVEVKSEYGVGSEFKLKMPLNTGG